MKNFVMKSTLFICIFALSLSFSLQADNDHMGMNAKPGKVKRMAKVVASIFGVTISGIATYALGRCMVSTIYSPTHSLSEINGLSMPLTYFSLMGIAASTTYYFCKLASYNIGQYKLIDSQKTESASEVVIQVDSV